MCMAQVPPHPRACSARLQGTVEALRGVGCSKSCLVRAVEVILNPLQTKRGASVPYRMLIASASSGDVLGVTEAGP